MKISLNVHTILWIKDAPQLWRSFSRQPQRRYELSECFLVVQWLMVQTPRPFGRRSWRYMRSGLDS